MIINRFEFYKNRVKKYILINFLMKKCDNNIYLIKYNLKIL